ncbi:cytochrome P450 [Streptomyces varsoviensis]|uniref:Cytochrome P450 n=1 Tax=Streptomyces varsoviensis TaxID=67373 RepID=A0ABR5J977_9ACTN|nr:cytochrome P450 [Streptomyces varsoviensis]KOG90001.1 cytochrome P450 [Streptomyces varsoviensis]
MPMHRTGGSTRAVEFAPRIAELLSRYGDAPLFRLEPDTIGIADPDLMNAVLSGRPANEHERPTFKPVQGRSVTRTEASAFMQALGADVRAALQRPVDSAADVSGPWPHAGHVYLRDLLFGREHLRFRVLVDRRLELTPKLTWAAVASGAAVLGRPKSDEPLSKLATLVLDSQNYRDRRHAMFLYRRMGAPMCFTVSALVTSALWLGAPFRDDMSNRNILLEALRLLPPSWNILRVASPEFLSVDERIGPGDDILLFPLLSHRNPKFWDDPEEFLPERWDELDSENHPGYLPFGPTSERCWARHMVFPLAERLLDLVRRDGLVVSPDQTKVKVELGGLLELSEVRMVRP